jgi:hypothetical protein
MAKTVLIIRYGVAGQRGPYEGQVESVQRCSRILDKWSGSEIQRNTLLSKAIRDLDRATGSQIPCGAPCRRRAAAPYR